MTWVQKFPIFGHRMAKKRNKMFKNVYKKILAGALLIGAMFLVCGFGSPAYAEGPSIWSDPGGALAAGVAFGFEKAFLWIFGTINLILGWLAKMLFGLAGYLITYGLQLNATVMTNPVVLIGWAIARNLANLAIVFGLIFIAFATILRIDSWGAKKLLADLIIVALLINFSLLIPGIFIDASGVVTNFFAQKVTGSDVTKITEVIASATDIAKLENISYADLFSATQGTTAGEIKAGEFSQGMINVIVQMFFMALFTYFAAIVLFNVAFIIFKRFFTLLALLVMAPLASTAYIFPSTKKYFSEWWNSLINQSISLPVIMFFTYLAVLIGVESGSGGTNANFFANIATIVNRGFESSFTNIFAQVGKMVTILGLLKVSLIAGEKLGAEGAAAGLGMMKSAQSFALGALTGGAAAGMTGTVFGSPVRGLAGRLTKEVAPGVTRGQSWAAGLARIPGFSGIARGLDRISTPDTESSRAQYSNMSDSLLMATAKGTSRMNSQEALGITQELESRKILAKMDDADLKALAAKGGPSAAKIIYKVRPDLSGNPTLIRENIKKLSSTQIAELPAIAFTNSDVVFSLFKDDLDKITKDARPLITNIKKTFTDKYPNWATMAPPDPANPDQPSFNAIKDRMIDPIWGVF